VGASLPLINDSAMQQFFPQGFAFDGNGFFGTAVTAAVFSYSQPIEGGEERTCNSYSQRSRVRPLRLRRSRADGMPRSPFETRGVSYFASPVGTRAFNSSNQFCTTMISCRGASSPARIDRWK
jgi:hypothetical protein